MVLNGLYLVPRAQIVPSAKSALSVFNRLKLELGSLWISNGVKIIYFVCYYSRSLNSFFYTCCYMGVQRGIDHIELKLTDRAILLK